MARERAGGCVLGSLSQREAPKNSCDGGSRPPRKRTPDEFSGSGGVRLSGCPPLFLLSPGDGRTSSVYHLQSRYGREGTPALPGTGRGGPHRAWLSPQQERHYLDSVASFASQGSLAEVSVIRRAYEQEVGQAVAPSTLYRLPAGHGWRQLVPRLSPPDTSREAQEPFPKSPALWCAPSPNATHSAAGH